ncbi:MAG: rod shape-determining protein RodA [Gammaproteobacteria bacterium]
MTLAQRLHIDIPLLLGVSALAFIGLVVLYSASGQDMRTVLIQAARLLVAFAIMFAVARFSPMQLARWSLWFYVAGLLLLVVVLFYGDVGKGAQRWLDIKIIKFQPSEIMKLALPMVMAWYLSDSRLPPSLWRILVALFMIAVPVLLIARQPDLGTAVLVAAAGCSVLFIAGISWKLLLAGACVLISLSFPLWSLMHEYQKQRVLTFLNPEQDPLGAGYHIIQSTIAIGSGGLYGKGWLNGTQSYLEFLPERSTDFIFAVFCEEFGLTGVAVLLGLYLFVVGRGLYIAARARQAYGKLLGAGLILTFFVYIFVNMGMVSGQLPVVGVPLPLISRGGSSMLTIMAGFGILMAIKTHRRFLTD